MTAPSPTRPATRDWPAPAAPAGVTGTVEVPGSKSLTNRALVLAALADGPSTIRSPLLARDTLLMVDGVRALGVDVTGGRTAWHVTPPAAVAPAVGTGAGGAPGTGSARFRGGVVVDTGLAGTVMRFLPLLVALAGGPVTFDGDPRARERPMAATIASLVSLGVAVDDGGRGTLPFTVRATGTVRGGDLTLDSSASSQFLSALLLVAPALTDGLAVRHVGPPLPSRDHVAMTVAMLRERGVAVDDTVPDLWRVSPGAVHAVDVTVEPDLSTAAPFLAAALAAGGSVTVARWPASTTQPGGALPGLLERMGASVTTGPAGLTVTGDGRVRGLTVDLADAPELVPVIAALAALADSPSRITGVAHVRGQESDRLAALATEIGALGGDVAELPDGLVVTPRPLHAVAGRPFATYADHRIAHAGAVLGLVVPGIVVADIATTGKTFPDFAARWEHMAAPAATRA